MTDTVCFVIGDRRDPRSGMVTRGPVGTAFFAAVPWRPDDPMADGDSFCVYVVTAAHLVTGPDQSSIRMRGPDGKVVGDWDDPEWTITEHDLAFALFPRSMPGASVSALQLAEPDEKFSPFKLGEQVYYVGLLADMPHMERENIPVVRSGNLAAWNQPHVPIKNGLRVTAHLIDCRSFGGFSGSPCLLQFTQNVLSYEGGRSLITPIYNTYLIGMLTGHYDDNYLERQQGSPVLKLNVGVGIVMPTEQIRHALNSDEQVAMRKTQGKGRTVSVREVTLGSLDDAVSLAPLEFEEALEALLDVPPPDKAP